MFARGCLIGLIAAVWAGAAQAQGAACKAAPLTGAIEAPTQMPATQAARDEAVKAQQEWAKPRLVYGACQRAEIAAMAARVNALAEQINALVDDVAPIHRILSAARFTRDDAFRAFAQRRKMKPEDLPVAARSPLDPIAPPCPAPPALTLAPDFPKGETASVSALRKADVKLREWAMPYEAYLACRKAERQALFAAYQSAKAQYDEAQSGYSAYRASFNVAVAKFKSDIAKYSAKIGKPKP